MNIVKLGGSVINPDGKYNNTIIDELISLVKKNGGSFTFVVGGGKLCRIIQNLAKPFLDTALENEPSVALANDDLGIAITKINARYVLERFRKKLGELVYPEILIDPTQKPATTAKIFFAGGWKPGNSTDTDMMLLAKTFNAESVFKMSDFEIVKKIKPAELIGLSEQEKKKALAAAEETPLLTWNELKQLVGDEWNPGLNTPFDSIAVKIGLEIKKTVTLYIGKNTELPKMILGKKFRGTIVKG